VFWVRKTDDGIVMFAQTNTNSKAAFISEIHKNFIEHLFWSMKVFINMEEGNTSFCSYCFKYFSFPDYPKPHSAL
jgi:hypothetical protein